MQLLLDNGQRTSELKETIFLLFSSKLYYNIACRLTLIRVTVIYLLGKNQIGGLDLWALIRSVANHRVFSRPFPGIGSKLTRGMG